MTINDYLRNKSQGIPKTEREEGVLDGYKAMWYMARTVARQAGGNDYARILFRFYVERMFKVYKFREDANSQGRADAFFDVLEILLGRRKNG